MGKIKDGSTYLSNHLTANDYYCENEMVQGKWIGHAAKLFGIEHLNILKNDIYFERLRRNLHPKTANGLTPRNVKDRIAFYDFQCSAPKSISIMAVVMEDQRLRQAHDQSLAIAFNELEKFAARQVNIDGAHANAFTGNLCAALFTHDASRALDPQLHTHVVVANSTYDKADNKWYALEIQHMCKAIRYAGQVYTNELAIRVQKLGYNIVYEKTEKGQIKTFQISGIRKETIKLYSKRRKEIEKGIHKFIEKYGREPRPDEVHAISKETRSAKLEQATTSSVRKEQLRQLSSQELSELKRMHQEAIKNEHSNISNFESPQNALSLSRDHLFERASSKYQHEIIAEAINQNLGKIELERLKQEIKLDNNLFKLSKNSVADGLYDVFTTQQNLVLEKQIIEIVNKSKNQYTPIHDSTQSIIQSFDLEKDQIFACEGILKSTDQIQSLRGPAGSGKSYFLKALTQILENKGSSPLFQATTHSSASNLLSDGLSKCATLAKFLLNPEALYPKAELENSFWILDEAGLASTSQMAEYLKAAKKYNARVLLVGDTKQHSAVEAGDALAILEKHSFIQKHALIEIRRQKRNLEYLKAAKSMSEGNIVEGIKQLDRLGWVKDGMNYLDLAADQYIENRSKRIPTLLVSPTWEEIDHLNSYVRKKIHENSPEKEEYFIDAFKAYPWTKAQLKSCKNYEPGMNICLIKDIQKAGLSIRQGTVLVIEKIIDNKIIAQNPDSGTRIPLSPRELGIHWQTGSTKSLALAKADIILLQRNDRELGLKNNTRLEVLSIDDSKNIKAQDAQGRNYVIPSIYKSFTYGYAITSHKSQGLTSDEVIVAGREMDALGKYVSLTRGQLKAHLFTQNKKSFLNSENRNKPKNRPSAMDYIYKAIQETVQILRERFNKSINFHR